MLARTWKVLRLWGVALLGGLALGSTARAQYGAVAEGGAAAPGCGSCQTCVTYETSKHCCPPWQKHYQEGPPKLCFKKGCPKPICDPCDLKHYGYYQTCWHPFPFPPDYSHCAAPPVGALLPSCCPHRSQMKQEKQVKPDDKKMPDGGGNPLPSPTPNEGARTNTQPPTWLPPPAQHESTTNVTRYPEQSSNVTQGSALTQTSAPAPSVQPRPLPAMNENQWTPPPPPMPRPVQPVQPIRRTALEESTESVNSGVTRAVVQELAPMPTPAPTPAPAPTVPVTQPNSSVRILAGPGAPAPVPTPAPLPEPAPAPLPVPTQTITPVPAPVPIPVPVPTPAATATATPGEPAAERPRPGQDKSILPGVRMVNSQRILLDFNAAELTPEQQAAIELWWTRDGRTWTRDTAARLQENAIVTSVREEGTFGFSVIQHQSDGSGPKSGEQPQMWVEADWNNPVVKLLDVRFQRTAQNRQVALTWTASDRNLAQQPIALSYAVKPEGPWTTFAPSIANTGRYVWSLPGHITGPVFVRVEAFDLMGNVGLAQSAQPLSTSPTSGLSASRY